MARTGDNRTRGRAVEPQARKRAVVLGASMAGLLAARVLRDHFAEVVVLERDDLSAPGDRRGVPQGRHVHALLARGRHIFEELFPGISAELLADGAVECHALAEIRMTIAGRTLRQADAGYTLLQASRPFLEWRVRGRVRALPGVELVDNTTVAELLADPGGERVTGVRTADGEEIHADLVVSCLGRHGPIGDWLTGLGYEKPAEQGVRIDMKYASRYVRLPNGSVGGDKEIVIANQDPARGLALFAVEDGKHILTLIGYGSDHPPTDPDGFWRFAASVAPLDVREALVEAEVCGDIATYRYPANQRRRYERLARFPAGLLVLGDAVCSFSPAFGQGMTVSALQALQLREVLAAGAHDLRRRYFDAVARVIDDPWRITELFDLAMPHVDTAGRTPRRALGALTGVAMAVGERDAVIGARIARVAGLLDRPATIARPGLAGRAAWTLGKLAVGALRTPHHRNPPAAPLFDPLPHGPARGFHRLVVRSVMRDTADSAIVEFEIPEQLRDRFAYTAGQHVVIRGTRRGEPIRRSYSLCDAPDSGRVRIAVKRQPGGAFSSYVLDEQLTTGSALYVSEPSGLFIPELEPGARRDYAAIAAGSGITPIVSIIATVLATEPDSTVTLHYGSRDRTAVMLASSIHELRDRYPGRLRIVHYLSRQDPRAADDPAVRYRHGRMVAAEIARGSADRWFLCGPKTLVTDTVTALRAAGVDSARIRLELFDTRPPARPQIAVETATSRITLTGYGEPLEFRMPRDGTILEAALGEREDLPYSCLGGSCGTCRAVVIDGQTEMEPDPLLAITADEIARDRVLTCRARPVTEQVTLKFDPS